MISINRVGLVTLTFFLTGILLATYWRPSYAEGLSEAGRAKLRIEFDSPISSNVLYSTQRELFQRKEMIAIELGDKNLQTELVEKWLSWERDPSEALRIRWKLFWLLRNFGNVSRAGQVAEEVIRDTPWPVDRVMMGCYLGTDLVFVGKLGRVAQLADLINAAFPEARNTASPILRARMETCRATFQSRWLLAQGKLKESLQAAETSVAFAEQLLQLNPPNIGQAQAAISDAWRANGFYVVGPAKFI